MTEKWGGRGHDFKMQDPDANDKGGGLLVIATSIPADGEREWIQWIGRTARQDKPGQYYAVLCAGGANQLIRPAWLSVRGQLQVPGPDGRSRATFMLETDGDLEGSVNHRGSQSDDGTEEERLMRERKRLVKALIDKQNWKNKESLKDKKLSQLAGAFKNELCELYYKATKAGRTFGEWPQLEHEGTDSTLRTMLISPLQYASEFKRRVELAWKDEQALRDIGVALKGPPARWDKASTAERAGGEPTVGATALQQKDLETAGSGYRTRGPLIVVFLIDLVNAREQSIKAVEERFEELEFFDYVGFRGYGGEWFKPEKANGLTFNNINCKGGNGATLEKKQQYAKKLKDAISSADGTPRFGVGALCSNSPCHERGSSPCSLPLRLKIRFFVSQASCYSPLYPTVIYSIEDLKLKQDEVNEQLRHQREGHQKELERQGRAEEGKASAKNVSSWLVLVTDKVDLSCDLKDTESTWGASKMLEDGYVKVDLKGGGDTVQRIPEEVANYELEYIKEVAEAAKNQMDKLRNFNLVILDTWNLYKWVPEEEDKMNPQEYTERWGAQMETFRELRFDRMNCFYKFELADSRDAQGNRDLGLEQKDFRKKFEDISALLSGGGGAEGDDDDDDNSDAD